MRKSGLSSRLSALKAGRESKAAERPKMSSKKRFLDSPGWEQISELVYKKTTDYKNLRIPRDRGFLKNIYSLGIERDMLFFDLETTGLSGGAGNIAFLAGVGDFQNGFFQVNQFFLSDYPGEIDFLSALQEMMDTRKIWVSYNGKSFDASILKIRYLMNGRHPPAADHLDLLYPARRLWKNCLPDCSLGTIEKKILKKERTLDIPGSEIPDIYFKFLKTGEAPGLDRVFAHHIEDIVSLLELYTVLEAVLEKKCSIPIDESGLGTLLLLQNESTGMETLRVGFEEGNNRCGYLLGRLLKRRKAYEDAYDVWSVLWNRTQDVKAGVELAKDLEHRRQNYGTALEIVNLLLKDKQGMSPLVQSELEHRASRLMGKEKKLMP